MMQSLSLSMIVKNEEKHLERCLNSVQDVADEIIIVDTGSNDRTVEIAKSFGAKVFYFNWINDFSAARNFSLSKCTGNWVLYLDADEELKAESVEELRKFKNHQPAGVNCSVRSFGTEKTGEGVFRYPRLFPRAEEIQFSGKVHEQIIDSLISLNLPIIESNIEIIHYGYALDEAELKNKKERNLSILLSAEKSNSCNYDKLKLIQTLISLNRFDEAELRIEKVIKNKELHGKELSLAFYYLSTVKFEYNDLQSAQNFALKAAQKLKGKPELNYLLYLIYLRSNNLTEANKYLLETIETNKQLIQNPSAFKNENIIDQVELYLRAIKLNHALANYSKVEDLIFNFSEYVSQNRNVNKEIAFRMLRNLFIKYLLSNEEAELLAGVIKVSNLQSLSEIIATSDDKNKAIDLFNLFLTKYPNASVLHKNIGLLYSESNPQKALEFFNKSLEIEKEPLVYIYLISTYLSLSNTEKALDTFYLLKQGFEHNIQIQQKIRLLEQKLSAVLSLKPV